MPRGRGPQHKGARRQFTDEDTLAREVKELEISGGRRKNREENKDSDDSGSGDEAKKEDEAAGGSEEEEGDKGKARGVENLIESENPNRQPVTTKSVKKLGADAAAAGPELSRREREEIQRQRDREAYERLHAQHKTAEAQADLARLAIVRAQREEAAKKREAERQSKEGDAARRREDVDRSVAAKPAAVGRGGRSRAKKEREKDKKLQGGGGGGSPDDS